MDNMKMNQHQEMERQEKTKVNVNSFVYVDSMSIDEKEFNRAIRKPYSKKMGKNLKILDKLDSNPDYVKELYAEINGGDNLSQSSVSFVGVDLESFKKEMMNKIQEEIHLEEIKRKYTGTTYCRCGIEGCSIHEENPDGTISVHYTNEADVVNEEESIYRLTNEHFPLKEIETLILSGGYVKLYPEEHSHHGKYVHHSDGGDVIKVHEY